MASLGSATGWLDSPPLTAGLRAGSCWSSSGPTPASTLLLQQLLSDAGGADLGGQELVTVRLDGVEAAADWDNLWSPENYLGSARTATFASPNGAVLDTPHGYAIPHGCG